MLETKLNLNTLHKLAKAFPGRPPFPLGGALGRGIGEVAELAGPRGHTAARHPHLAAPEVEIEGTPGEKIGGQSKIQNKP